MTLRFLKCLVLVALVHVFAAATVFGVYHFAKAGQKIAEGKQSDTKTIPTAITTDQPTTTIKGDDGTRVQRHKVKNGESYWSIAQRYDVTIRELMATNGHKPNHVLQRGEEIRIPSNN